MLQSEFETLTDILPDVLLYEAAEHEYNTGDFASKADEDGLATKCQRIANERWLKAEEHIGKLTAENNRLEDENENLRNEIAALSDRVDELSDEIGEPPTATLEVTEPEITIQSIRTAIQQAYQDAAHDDCTGDQILHMVWGFEYLLQRLGVE